MFVLYKCFDTDIVDRMCDKRKLSCLGDDIFKFFMQQSFKNICKSTLNVSETINSRQCRSVKSEPDLIILL